MMMRYVFSVVLSLLLAGCSDTIPQQDTANLAHGVAMGALTGTVVGAIAGAPVPGILIGAGIGGILSRSQSHQLARLDAAGVRVIQSGSHWRLVLNSDQLFLPLSSELDERAYHRLALIADFLQDFPQARITVAAFTDDVLPRSRQRQLTYTRAYQVAGFLWAHGVSRSQLKPVGMTSRFPVARNNRLVGRSMNRRVEIRWQTS